eukprot:g1534.t1
METAKAAPFISREKLPSTAILGSAAKEAMSLEPKKALQRFDLIIQNTLKERSPAQISNAALILLYTDLALALSKISVMQHNLSALHERFNRLGTLLIAQNFSKETLINHTFDAILAIYCLQRAETLSQRFRHNSISDTGVPVGIRKSIDHTNISQGPPQQYGGEPLTKSIVDKEFSPFKAKIQALQKEIQKSSDLHHDWELLQCALSSFAKEETTNTFETARVLKACQKTCDSSLNEYEKMALELAYFITVINLVEYDEKHGSSLKAIRLEMKKELDGMKGEKRKFPMIRTVNEKLFLHSQQSLFTL